MAEEILGRIKGEVTLDSKGFTQGVAQINRQLNVLKTEFDASNAKIKAFGKSQDQLKAQAQLLTRQIELQKQKVSLLAKTHQEYSQKIGAEAKQTQQLAAQLNKAKAALANMQGAHQRLNTQLQTSSEMEQRYTRALDQLDQKMRLVQSEFRLSEAQAKAFGNSLDQARAQIAGLEKQIDLQKQKVSLLSLAYKDAAQSLGKNAKQTQEAAIRLNEARAALTGMEGSLKRLSTQFSQQNSLFGRFGQNMTKIREHVAEAGATLGVFSGAITVALGSAVKKAADFESQLSSIQAVTGATGQEMEQFRNLALEMGAKTKYSAAEAAQGIEELAKAGLSTTQIINGGLEGALNLAAAGELDLADAAQIASTVLNAFRADSLSVTQAANLLAGAANASATDVHELQFGLAAVSAVAAGVGLSFKDTATALAVFAQNGLKGSDAGTSLKTMLLNLTPATKPAIMEMKKLGIITADGKNQFFDAQGKVKSFAEIADVLQKHLSGLTQQQRLQALQTMFGTDAIRAANIAFKEGKAGVQSMYEAMSKTTAADVAAQRMNNLKGTIEQLNGAWETFQIQVGSAFLPILKELANDLNDVVDWFSKLSPSTKEAIGIFAGATAGVLALGAAVAGIIAISNPVTLAIIGIGTALAGIIAVNHKLSQDMKATEENAIRFGYGVSQGTIQAAKGYMDLRDQALINLAKLRTASGDEARRIVNETVNIFGQMGDKIVAALNQDKINVQKASAALLDQVPKTLQPAVQNVTDTAIKAIDAQIRRVQEANKIIRQGLIQYGGDVAKMPKQFARAYQQALKDLDQTSQTFVQKVSDLKSYMENINSDQGKITAQGARQWVKEIQSAYDQAVQAAHKWANEQRKVWEEQFANGNITKQQYDQILAIVDQGEKEKINLAKQARAEDIRSLEQNLSDEANLYDLKTGEMLDRYQGYVTAKAGLMASDADVMRRGKEINHEYFESIIQDAENSAAEVKKKQQELIKLYGDMGTASVNKLADMIKKGGDRAQLAAEALAVKTRDGFKIDLGPAGQVSVQSFIKGLQTGQYTVRDVAIAHMTQLRDIYGSGNFTPEGIKAIESFTNGLRSKKPEEIAKQLGLDLKSNMKIDLGPLGKVSAQTFAKGLSDGTYSFDAVYAYYRNQLKQGMTFDLSPEGQHNIETLKLGMQAKAIDVQEAASLLGLDVKSKVKVNLGPEGQFTVQTLLAGLQSGKINIQTFAQGIEKLLKTDAKADLFPEGKAAGDSQAKGLNASKPNVQKAASSLKSTTEKTLGATSDGGGGKKAGDSQARGLNASKPNVQKAASSVKSTTEKTLGAATDGGGGKKAGSQFAGGIAANKGKAGSSAGAVASAAKSNLKVNNTYSLGLDVASGFASGILGGEWGVIQAAASIARSAWNAIKREMDINSPSRRTMELGKFTAMGLEEGLKQRIFEVQRVSRMLALAVTDPLREYFRSIVEDGDYLNDWLTHLSKNIADPLRKYFQAIAEDGDYMNDWLTYLPDKIRKTALETGKVFASSLGFKVDGPLYDAKFNQNTQEVLKALGLDPNVAAKDLLSKIRQISNLLSQAALPVTATGARVSGTGATVQSVTSNVSAPVSVTVQFTRPVFLQNRSDMQRLGEELAPFISSALNKQDTLLNRAKGVIQFGS